MFALAGFSFLTFAALLGGILVHTLKQFSTARSNKSGLTTQSYFVRHWPETGIAVICSLVLWAGVPEIVDFFPDFARSIGLGGEIGIITSFVCGFFGNSLADLVGGRARAVSYTVSEVTTHEREVSTHTNTE